MARLVLERGRPGDHLLISNYLLAHLGNDTKSRNDFLDSRGEPIEGTSRKLRLYLDALAGFSAAARRRGLTVTLVGAGPRLVRRDHCLPEWFRSGRTMRSCEAAYARDQEAARRLNRRLQAGLPPGVAFLDPLQQLCPQGCERDAMRRLLLDDDHLSEEAVLGLLPELRRLLNPPPAPSRVRLAR